MTVVWVNGPFGVGKTTVVELMRRQWSHATILDPEEIAYLITRWKPRGMEVYDFQDLQLWRDLVSTAIVGSWQDFGRPLLIPMTLLNKDYHRQIMSRLGDSGVTVRHFCLEADRTTVENRLNRRYGGPSRWCLERFDHYAQSLDDPQFAEFIPTKRREPLDIAGEILSKLS